MELNLFIHYTTILIALFAAMLIYFKIADKYNIIDKPNQRSSHNYITIRGGGIVFWIAGVLFSLVHLPESSLFLIGFTFICGVSFWDDVSSLSSRVRIFIHFFSISILFYSLNIYNILPWWLVIITYIFVIGVINAYNFMDGINGITGLYSLVILGCLQYINQRIILFTYSDFINYAILACIVFLFFNFRKKAKCFAGDIGSVGISFWIVTLLLQLILTTNSVIWILFLAVYGVDSIYTILHRLYLKQNIFKPHRLHFYQILSNECKIPHLAISSLYASSQLIICIFIIYFYDCKVWSFISIALSVVLPLSLIYLIKFKLIKLAKKNRLQIS